MDTNKTALITGGSRGIGRAIVLSLAHAGWQVAFNYHSQPEAASETLKLANQSGQDCLSIQADLCDSIQRKDLIEKVLARFNKIDLLINNAGTGPRKRIDLLEMSESSFDEVMNTNLKGPLFLTQQIARLMVEWVKQGQCQSPKIINIGSISSYTSSPQRGEYCLSKAGIAMMTSLFADRLAKDGVLVYELRPGIIETDMTAGVRDKYDRMIEEGLLPIQRWGKPEDIARAVMAIAENYLPYSTGEVINIDGGFHLRRL